MLWKCCTQYSENLENSAVATWLERSVFIPIPKMSNAEECSNYCIISLISYASWRSQWHPSPVLLPGKPHVQRSLVGCSPLGRYKLDTTEQLHFHFSLSCIGERNGNPLQYSCLENPSDGRAWWAAIYGVAQSRTRLRRLSSSSSIC